MALKLEQGWPFVFMHRVRQATMFFQQRSLVITGKGVNMDFTVVMTYLVSSDQELLENGAPWALC